MALLTPCGVRRCRRCSGPVLRGEVGFDIYGRWRVLLVCRACGWRRVMGARQTRSAMLFPRDVVDGKLPWRG